MMTDVSAFPGAPCCQEETREGTVALSAMEGAMRDGNFQLLNKVEMEKKWEF